MELLTIGAFARVARLTPRALRLYDERGLLSPAAVDPESGYRFYDPGQLERAQLIAQLRRIGMPLDRIRVVCELKPADAALAVEAYWRQVTTDTSKRRRIAALLVEHLSERGTTMSENVTIGFRYATRCDIGAVRDSNEDSAYASDTLIAVADGGRGPGGAEASAAAIDALKALELADVPTAELLSMLARATASADRAVRGVAGDHQPISTLSAMVRRGTHLALVHVGDTRVYLLRGGELFPLTQDHTWVQAQVDQGRLDREEAAAHPDRALLVRALGAGAEPVEADLALRTALPGDRYLLCSDGLSAVVGRDALLAALGERISPDDVAQRMVEFAYAAGAPDNIACVVADVVTV